MPRQLLRRIAWVGVAVCVVTLAFGITVRLLGPTPPGVTRANCERIQEGMSRREVVALLGEPSFTAVPKLFGKGPDEMSFWGTWERPVYVGFQDGRVLEMEFDRTAESPISRLLPWPGETAWKSRGWTGSAGASEAVWPQLEPP